MCFRRQNIYKPIRFSRRHGPYQDTIDQIQVIGDFEEVQGRVLKGFQSEQGKIRHTR